MDDLAAQNLAFLARNHPALCNSLRGLPTAGSGRFTLSREPLPNILFNGKPFHSAAHPQKEAEILARGSTVKEGTVFIFMGIGMGYQIEAFRRLHPCAGGPTLVAIERSIEAFALLLKTRDISFLAGIHLFVGDEEARIGAFFDELSPLSFKGYRIISLRGARDSFAGYYGAIETSFKRTLAGKLSDVLTRFAFESLWMKNIIRNVPNLVGSPSIRALKGALKGEPALVICAGPSLAGQLGVVRELGRSVRVIAVDTVLEALAIRQCTSGTSGSDDGFSVDFVVTLDAQFHNLHDFTLAYSPPLRPGPGRGDDLRRGPLRDTVLVADLVAYPKILKVWGQTGRAIAFTAAAMEGKNPAGGPSFGGGGPREVHPLATTLSGFHGPIDSLPCGGSVATTAIEFALYAGADPVVVLGLDLAYSGFLTHARSSAPYRMRAQAENRLGTLLTSMTGAILSRNPFPSPGLGGREALTDFVFQGYGGWLTSREHYRGRVINATREGLEVPGLREIELDALADRLCRGERGNQKSTVRLNGAEGPLTDRTAFDFLETVRKGIADATLELKAAKGNPGAREKASLSRHPFLKNLLPEAERLHGGAKLLSSHLASLLAFLSMEVDRSIERLKNRYSLGR
jgi:hypothetical protein